MDGTTLDDSHRVPKKNIEALEKAIQSGHEVVIITGRTTSSAAYLLKTHHLDEIGCRYVIAYNGGQILDCRTHQVLFMKTLPLDYVKELMIRARKEGVYLQTYADEVVLTERDDENLAQYLKKTSMEARVVPDIMEELSEEPCKMLAIHLHDHSVLDRFCESVRDWAEDKVDLYYSDALYLEIMPKGICKGSALRLFCEKFGIPIENAIAVGDEENDISMIRAAGVGCAVANAQDKVKAVADYVTKNDNNHSAVAEVVDKFILGPA